jgi:DNA-binding phage protein
MAYSVLATLATAIFLYVRCLLATAKIGIMTRLQFDPEAMRQRILDELKRQRRSQSDVAEKAGLGHGYLTNILKRGQMPSVDKLHALANELGVSVAWIMYGVDVPPDFDRVLDLMNREPKKFHALMALLD